MNLDNNIIIMKKGCKRHRFILLIYLEYIVQHIVISYLYKIYRLIFVFKHGISNNWCQFLSVSILIFYQV